MAAMPQPSTDDYARQLQAARVADQLRTARLSSAASGGTQTLPATDAPPVQWPTLQPATGGPLPAANDQGSGVNVKPGSTSVLPFSWDQTGTPKFDPSVGVLGSIGSAATLPGDVYNGRVSMDDPSIIPRAANFAAMASPAAAGDTPLIGNTFRAKTTATVPTSEELRTAAGAGYDAARGMGVDYSSDAIAKVAAAAQAKMEADGIIAPLAPKTFSILNQLTSPPSGSVAPFTGVEAARRAAANAGRDFNNPTDQLASRHLVDAIDQFVANPDPGAVVSGPASLAANTVGDARGNYAAASRSDTVQGIGDAADLRAAAANSGANGDNAIRSRVASLLLNPKQLAGFSPDEVAQLQQVASGTAPRNTIRFVGNLLGGGGGVGAIAAGAAGAEAGNTVMGLPGAIAGAATPAAGYAAKLVANAMTKRALAKADEAVRTRSPLYNQRVAASGMEPISAEARAAVVKALLAQRLPSGAMPTSAPQLYDTTGKPIPAGATIY